MTQKRFLTTPWDNLPAMHIAVPLKPVIASLRPANLFPKLHAHGIVPLLDRSADTIRWISRIQLDKNQNLCLTEVVPEMLQQAASIGDARRIFEESGMPLVPLLDRSGDYSGYCASQLELQKMISAPRGTDLPKIGGFATPLGVYLTTGRYTAGAGLPGLLATGAAFAALCQLAPGLAGFLMHQVPWLEQLPICLQVPLLMLSLLATVRLSQVSGFHAAEHQVIHAMEQNLPLTLPVVSSQPRCHPRCGSNLMVIAVGLTLLVMGTATLRPTGYAWIFASFGLMGLLFFRKPLGFWVQRMMTTRPPKPSQVYHALCAGEALIKQYQACPHDPPTRLQRLWSCGIIQVICSFAVTFWLMQRIIEWLSNGF